MDYKALEEHLVLVNTHNYDQCFDNIVILNDTHYLWVNGWTV